jgi:hypothetical protein
MNGIIDGLVSQPGQPAPLWRTVRIRANADTEGGGRAGGHDCPDAVGSRSSDEVGCG